jgi:hypothetical protein
MFSPAQRRNPIAGANLDFQTISRLIHPVLKSIAKWLLVSALCFSLGLHWALLQGIAWTGMVVSYAENSSLSEAVAKTFDGRHPCKICKIVTEGKKSEQRQDVQKPALKLETSLPATQVVLFHPSFISPPAALPDSPLARSLTPPTPPPRPSLA